MEIKTYILYDSLGRYRGRVEGSIPPTQIDEGISCRILTQEELSIIGLGFEYYDYNEPIIKKFPKIYFLVGSPPIYEIGIHNKISISVKPTESMTEEERAFLADKEIEVTINNNKVFIPFDSQAFLDPTEPGVYIIELTDERVTASIPKYTIPVILST